MSDIPSRKQIDEMWKALIRASATNDIQREMIAMADKEDEELEARAEAEAQAARRSSRRKHVNREHERYSRREKRLQENVLHGHSNVESASTSQFNKSTMEQHWQAQQFYMSAMHTQQFNMLAMQQQLIELQKQLNAEREERLQSQSELKEHLQRQIKLEEQLKKQAEEHLIKGATRPHYAELAFGTSTSLNS